MKDWKGIRDRTGGSVCLMTYKLSWFVSVSCTQSSRWDDWMVLLLRGEWKDGEEVLRPSAMLKHSCISILIPEISFTDTSGMVKLLFPHHSSYTLSSLSHESQKRERAFLKIQNHHPFQILPNPGPWGEGEGKELPAWVSPLVSS